MDQERTLSKDSSAAGVMIQRNQRLLSEETHDDLIASSDALPRLKRYKRSVDSLPVGYTHDQVRPGLVSVTTRTVPSVLSEDEGKNTCLGALAAMGQRVVNDGHRSDLSA
eukprot:4535776-Pleurochrysis_carterae.AAC.4